MRIGDFIAANGTALADIPDLLGPAMVQTAQMVGAVIPLTVLFGIPLALAIHNTAPDGLLPAPRVHAALSAIINLARSLPFLILMVAIIPLTRLIVGSTIGIAAAIVPMTIAAIPYFARLVETALRELPPEMIDMSRASGGSPAQTMLHVQFKEALPAIVANITIITVNVLGLSTMAGAVGAGGVGDLAINYGYNRFDNNLMIATVLVLLITVQIIQFTGDRVARWLARRG